MESVGYESYDIYLDILPLDKVGKYSEAAPRT